MAERRGCIRGKAGVRAAGRRGSFGPSAPLRLQADRRHRMHEPCSSPRLSSTIYIIDKRILLSCANELQTFQSISILRISSPQFPQLEPQRRLLHSSTRARLCRLRLKRIEKVLGRSLMTPRGQNTSMVSRLHDCS